MWQVLVMGMDTDMYTLMMTPIPVVVLVPLCLAGDRLEQAKNGVMRRAYGGPWLETTPDQRRLLLCIMLAAQDKGSRLRSLGIGPLNRRTCFIALKNWFNVLQTVLNLRQAQGQAH